jgi:1-acyl-sn-glycerol-3-phosphate acyltransferase
MSPFQQTWFKFCRWLVRVFVYQVGGGFSSSGQENIPTTGPVILAPVHVSHLDPPAVACGCRRVMRFMAKEELFKVPVFGPLIRSLGAFPVKRGEGDTESIRFSMEVLERGEMMLIFPEGTRGDGETLLPMNRGVAMLAKRTQAKVIPVAIIGSFQRLPRGRSKLKRGRIRVIYGQPFTYADVGTSSSEKENRELFAGELARRLSTLCTENGMPLQLPAESA